MSQNLSTRDIQNTQHALLCLSTRLASDTEIDEELQIAREAGFACVELWAPALEAYLARHPVIWLDLQMREHGIHTLIVDGLAPLSSTYGTRDEDDLVLQARFLELCAHLDALGGATIVLHPAAGQQGNQESGLEANVRAYADLAAPFDVSLAFEFRADSAIPTLEAAQMLVKRAAQSNLRLSISTHEWCRSQRTLEALVPRQLALVHLESPLSLPPQAAQAPEPSPTPDEPALTLALCEHLAAAGFRGPYCLSSALEADALPNPGTPLERARKARQAAQEALAPLYADAQAP
jgi:hypothetical protein